MRHKRFLKLSAVAVLGFVLLVAGCGRGGDSRLGQGTSKRAISDRGPGLRRQSLASLQLPVPRTLDLTHVDPAHYAAALGNDPVRIFEFVRDTVAFEAYPGLLRGPRGTLLALAGNSVDRAALLGAMLERAGQRVRYVQGALPETDARDLVRSMWATGSVLSPAPRPANPSPAIKKLSQDLRAAARQDYDLIVDQLKKTSPKNASPAPTSDMLVAEAKTHYWVQWARDGSWVDMDPSFADAAPKKVYAVAQETLDALPDALQHRVTLSVHVEESTNGNPSSRQILTFSATSAELSGVDLILVHVPENWTGPASSLGEAISAAISDTGRVKPVIVVGTQPVVGDPFQQKIKSTGIGGVGPLLSGQGTRKAVPLATAEWLQFEFRSPEGRRDVVVREIFDIVGKARRTAGRHLAQDEVLKATQTETAVDIARAVYSISFTTGHLFRDHLTNLARETAPASQDGPDVGRSLRRIALSFTVLSDSLLARLGRPEQEIARFYPDVPRVVVVEASAQSKASRISIDLRRFQDRGVIAGAHPEALVRARILRGAVNGVLERVVIDYVTAAARDKGVWGPLLSTSLLIEKAVADRVPVLLLPRDNAQLDSAIPADALARIQEDISQGAVAVAPQRAITLGGVPHYAWWKVDPGSGETTAVTDEGLHAAGVEYVLVKQRNGLVVLYMSTPAGLVYLGVFNSMNQDSLMDFVFQALLDGAEFVVQVSLLAP